MEPHVRKELTDLFGDIDDIDDDLWEVPVDPGPTTSPGSVPRRQAPSVGTRIQRGDAETRRRAAIFLETIPARPARRSPAGRVRANLRPAERQPNTGRPPARPPAGQPSSLPTDHRAARPTQPPSRPADHPAARPTAASAATASERKQRSDRPPVGPPLGIAHHRATPATTLTTKAADRPREQTAIGTRMTSAEGLPRTPACAAATPGRPSLTPAQPLATSGPCPPPTLEIAHLSDTSLLRDQIWVPLPTGERVAIPRSAMVRNRKYRARVGGSLWVLRFDPQGNLRSCQRR